MAPAFAQSEPAAKLESSEEEAKPVSAQAQNPVQQHELNVSKNQIKVGLALGGGGTRGAAHVGVLKILEQEGVQIDYIAGTNVGAIVGGLYSAGVSISSLEDMFKKKSLMRAYLTVPLKVRIMIVPLLYLPRLMSKKAYDGLYKGNQFRNFLNKYVPQSEQDIEDLKIPFGAVALNLLTGKTETIRSGNLGKALQASSAIPVLRKPVKLGEGLYVDGSVTNNLPVEEVKAMGADVVIAVDLDGHDRTWEEREFNKIGSVSHRVITLHFANVDMQQSKKADLMIVPDIGRVGLVDTGDQTAQNAIQAGERAAIEAIDKIKKLIAQ